MYIKNYPGKIELGIGGMLFTKYNFKYVSTERSRGVVENALDF